MPAIIDLRQPLGPAIPFLRA